MTGDTIQDWTDAKVLRKRDDYCELQYRVYRLGPSHFLEMADPAGDPIHTLEMPDGMKLDRSSYEVLLRYVVLDVLAA